MLTRFIVAACLSLCVTFALVAPASALDRRLRDAAADADALFRNGDLEGASEALEQALSAAEAMLGKEHPDVAELTARLSLLHLYRNDLENAERLAERALALREKILGNLDPAVAASLMDLASIRLVQGRNPEAGELYRRVLDLWTQSKGPQDEHTVQARANLADFLEARGELAEAQRLRAVDAEPRSTAPSPRAAPACPVTAAELLPPPWSGNLATSLFKIALEHEERIAHALAPVVHNFGGMPPRATFDTVFPVDADRAYSLGRELHALAAKRDRALMTLFALVYAARERLNVAMLERFAPSPTDAPDYQAISLPTFAGASSSASRATSSRRRRGGPHGSATRRHCWPSATRLRSCCGRWASTSTTRSRRGNHSSRVCDGRAPTRCVRLRRPALGGRGHIPQRGHPRCFPAFCRHRPRRDLESVRAYAKERHSGPRTRRCGREARPLQP
jgi:tetratricopeptide (TPR) repeat protein